MSYTLHEGDCLEILKTLPEKSVHCCVTSPPYWGLRDYGVDGQLGLEKTPEEYVVNLVTVFQEVKRVLRDDGTVWLNLGDSYAAVGKSGGGSQGERWEDHGADTEGPRGGKWRPAPPGLKPKDLVGIPWRTAFALQKDGWYLRSDIIWAKSNPMPESVTDRPTKSHEYIFLLSKNERYYYDNEAIREICESPPQTRDRNKEGYAVALGDSRTRFSPGARTYGLDGLRNKRSVWVVLTHPFKQAHFATFPPKLIEPCILAGSPAGGVVLDPFAGAGTTLLVAEENNRNSIGIELNPDYCEIIRKRLKEVQPSLFEAVTNG